MICTWPSICLVVKDQWGDRGWINDVRREGSRFFWAMSDDEVVVRHNDLHQPAQMALFDEDEEEEPYHFRDGVDYTIYRGVFHCTACGDFNGQPLNSVAQVAVCPQCGKWSDRMLMLMPAPKEVVN